jgi:hypothetical protein
LHGPTPPPLLGCLILIAAAAAAAAVVAFELYSKNVLTAASGLFHRNHTSRSRIVLGRYWRKNICLFFDKKNRKNKSFQQMMHSQAPTDFK